MDLGSCEMYCDSTVATYLYVDTVFHSRIKHIVIGLHFASNQICRKKIHVNHVHSIDQLIDSLTKSLSY